MTKGRTGQAVRIPPRGPITVSWSEIDAAHQCPFKHDLSYIERWSKPPRGDSPLAKGTLFHACLEANYRSLQSTQGESPGKPAQASDAVRLKACREAVAEVLMAAEDAAGRDQYALDTVDLVAWMVDGYWANYGIDENWWIAATEHSAQVRLPNETGGRSRFVLKFKIDLVVATRVGLHAVGAGSSQTPSGWRTYVVDHKSGKDLPRDKELELDDQFGLYTWGLHRLGRRVFGQLYNAARTFRKQAEATDPAPLDTRFSRYQMYRTDSELERIAIEAYQTVRTRYRQQADCDRLGIEPPRHTDPDRCRWRCDFTDPCLLGRKTDRANLIDYLTSSGFAQDFTRH